jgi:DNA-binding NarL/FixJ family response regulator
VLKESASRDVVDAVRAVAEGRRYLSAKISDIVTKDYVAELTGIHDDGALQELTDREREILQLVVEGKSTAQIARKVHLAETTVSTYRSRMMRKLGVRSVPGLVKFAITHGITSSE